MKEYVVITNSKGETLEIDTDLTFDIEIIRENRGARLTKSLNGSYVKEFQDGCGLDTLIKLHSNYITEDLGVIEDNNEQSDD